MNELVRVGNYPPSDLTQINTNFPTASKYFQELARQHFLHLKHQRNNAIEDEQSCRKMYIARCLFRNITRQIPAQSGPFRLYCDDLRPANVLVSEPDFTVEAVIDWEFAYSAPVEFSQAAPWWLLFESPEAWESDLSEFLERYQPRLELFLKEMRACEDSRIQAGAMHESDRLSGPMAASMTNGMFWLCLAARKSFMFDDIYWTFLDEKFFGRLDALEDRLSLLSDEEREGINGFVEEKMRQKSECTLDEHLTFDDLFAL
ncbi:phosphotransferase enzyme family protein [Hirsutella rhossiliensis]|uniref:Phosphotransferase enzyme family domain-containing protein n=1 Tax=Hirsutella rhossiliensis TaxID=111463 RepID=A0A9P8MVQ6_9HYPO|nr:phosphotransferase enzyme family domain-containing protein [Hirsutella rhossiliensis]KAH0961121.1 phosphotransferase enzyme family domain-containing protein [Hirsutella rhossiliensis]